MSNIQVSLGVLEESHQRFLKDKALRVINMKLVEIFNTIMPTVVRTDDGECYLDYPYSVKELVNKIEEERRIYLEQNYPELLMPF